MADLLERCRQLAASPELTLACLQRALRERGVSEAERAALGRADLERPYGRQVLLSGDHLEAMLATWTRGAHCAPHTHGGSIGGVRVIQGEGLHRVYQVRGGRLALAREHSLRPGDIVAAGADLIHSMGDAGGDVPMMTLHLYTDAIDHMLVYDLLRDRTLVVDGGCGAWIPDDEPSMIRSVTDGIHTARALMGARAGSNVA